jgi:hypothetical protein
MTDKVKDETQPTISQMIKVMATEARAKGQKLLVKDARYGTSGIPSVITDDFLYFEEGVEEVYATGKLGDPLSKSERVPGGKLVRIPFIIDIQPHNCADTPKAKRK